jgi:hypothetical protein
MSSPQIEQMLNWRVHIDLRNNQQTEKTDCPVLSTHKTFNQWHSIAYIVMVINLTLIFEMKIMPLSILKQNHLATIKHPQGQMVVRIIQSQCCLIMSIHDPHLHPNLPELMKCYCIPFYQTHHQLCLHQTMLADSHVFDECISKDTHLFAFSKPTNLPKHMQTRVKNNILDSVVDALCQAMKEAPSLAGIREFWTRKLLVSIAVLGHLGLK